MKLVNDDGTLIQELPDDAALLIFREEGLSSILPSAESLGHTDEDEVPDHILMAGMAMVYLTDPTNRETVADFFKSKVHRAH